MWDLIALKPMINSLIVLTSYLANNLGLSIIILTIIVNLVLTPLIMKQLHASKKMQDLQPKLAEIQKKYAKDRQKLGQEQMKLYRESGMSPAGCGLPMLIQMPVWIALFQSIMRLVAVIPENFLNLSQYLYSWPIVYSALPLENRFLWLNLATGDIFLAILVGGTMWVQQKMVTPTTADPQQQQQSQMMLWMMPMMFGVMCLTFPSGLSLYWVTSNIIRIIMQYFVTGWGSLIPGKATQKADRDKKYKKRIAQVEQAPTEKAAVSTEVVTSASAEGEALSAEESEDKRPERRVTYPASLRATKRHPRRGRGHNPKRK